MREMTLLPEHILQTMLRNDIVNTKTMREIASAILDVDRSIFNVPKYKDINMEVELPKGVLQVLVVLRRLGLSTEEMIAAFQRAIVQYPKEMISNIGGYVLVKHNTLSKNMYFPSDRKDYVVLAKIKEIHPNTATCNVEIYYEGNNDDSKLNIYEEFVQWLLSFVGM